MVVFWLTMLTMSVTTSLLRALLKMLIDQKEIWYLCKCKADLVKKDVQSSILLC